jgi:hypothetical protein
MLEGPGTGDARLGPPSESPHTGFVTLRDLIAEESLRLGLVEESSDLERPIRYVYQTELEDPSSYLEGNELILTVGMPFLEESRITDYVDVLHRSRVSALGLGLGEHFTEPPAALVAACAAVELPLLTVAAGQPFRAVVDWIGRRRDAAREQGVRERELGALLGWCASGTLGVQATEDLLSRYGLAGRPLLVIAFPQESHELVHHRGIAEEGAVAVMQDSVVVLGPHSEELLGRVRSTGQPGGVSAASDAGALSVAVLEALEALQVARRSAKLVHARDIVTLEGLLAAVPSVRLIPFVQHFVVPLVEYDALHRTQLVATLRAFLENSSNPSAVATSLYVHVNTLRNRLLKICEITGADPYIEENRTGYRVGIWAARQMGLSGSDRSG